MNMVEITTFLANHQDTRICFRAFRKVLRIDLIGVISARNKSETPPRAGFRIKSGKPLAYTKTVPLYCNALNTIKINLTKLQRVISRMKQKTAWILPDHFLMGAHVACDHLYYVVYNLFGNTQAAAIIHTKITATACICE